MICSCSLALALGTSEAEDGDEIADPTMIEGLKHPFPKDLKVEVDGLGTSLIENRSLQRGVSINISFEDISKNTRPGCPKHIIKHRKPVSKEDLPRIPVEKSEIKLTEDKYHIFVEVVANEHSNSSIAPSTMSHDELLEELEFADCIVSTSNSLCPFFTSNTNSYVSFHDHWHIIGSITD